MGTFVVYGVSVPDGAPERRILVARDAVSAARRVAETGVQVVSSLPHPADRKTVRP